MTAINFPNSPAVNDTFEDQNGFEWVWNGTVWRRGATAIWADPASVVSDPAAEAILNGRYALAVIHGATASTPRPTTDTDAVVVWVGTVDPSNAEANDIVVTPQTVEPVPRTALWLPASSGSYVSTPDAAAHDITGDIDVRVWCAADDWTPASIVTLAAKYNSSGNQRSWRFLLDTTGALSLRVSTDGTGAAETAVQLSSVPGFADGTSQWVRATLDVDNGSGSKVYTYYTSTDGETWTQLSTHTVAGTTSIYSSTAAVEVGSVNAGTAGLFAGKVMRAQVYNGIGGTLTADYRATAPMSPYRDSLGNVWTLNGSGWRWMTEAA